MGLCKKEYGIKLNMRTTTNPQDDSIVVRIHKKLSNMVCTIGLEDSGDL